jgi:hypothetical protein
VKPRRIDAAARAELLHEVAYYEQVRAGAGRRFRQSVDALLERIQRSPLAGVPDEAGTRRLRVKGFPFSIVFREEAADIIVYAIRPDARRPGYWLERMK